jgi:hypothetical protein
MSENVRVFVGDLAKPLHWPARCPRCGAAQDLVESKNRLGRVKSMWGNRVTTQLVYFGVPMCRRHALPTRVANRLLERSPLPYLLLRLPVLLSFLVLALLLELPGGGRALVKPGASSWVLILIGVGGLAVLMWARWMTSFQPLGFVSDTHGKVIELRIADRDYAADFKRLNPDATDPSATRQPPWFKRTWPWQLLVIGLFVAYLAYITFAYR